LDYRPLNSEMKFGTAVERFFKYLPSGRQPINREVLPFQRYYGLELDPENTTLLARSPKDLRITAELIRDQALKIIVIDSQTGK